MKTLSEFLSENFQFLVVKFSIYLNRRIFVMVHLWFHLRRLRYHLFLISPSFGASGRLYFVIVLFPGYLYLYFSLKLTHLCRMGSSTLTLWTGLFPVKEVSGSYLLLPWFTEIPVLNANSVDPDQTPRSAASDLGLRCLLMSLLWDTRHMFANVPFMGHQT